MSLKYEPGSEPLHISVEWLFLNEAGGHLGDVKAGAKTLTINGARYL